MYCITKINCIMRTKVFLSLMVLTILSLGFLDSCKKREEPDNDYSSSLDYTKSEDATNSTFNLVNDYGIREAGLKGMQADSVDMSISPVIGWPKTLTLDFGTTGIICNDGRTRKGVLQAVFSGHWHPDSITDGTNVHITFNGYYVKETPTSDWVQRDGEFIVTYQGANPGPYWEIQAIDAQLIYSDGTFTKWNTVRTTYWVAGYDTPTDETDDIFEFDGTTSGVSKVGTNFSVKITKTLRFDKTCVVDGIRGTFVSGTFELTPGDKPTRVVDFGSGTCDRAASVTISGVTFNFTY